MADSARDGSTVYRCLNCEEEWKRQTEACRHISTEGQHELTTVWGDSR